MSRTLEEYEVDLEERFKELAKFCTAESASRNLRMVADFLHLPHKPRFLLVLRRKNGDRWIVENIAIIPDSEEYLDPMEVLYNLGKVFPEEGGNNWEIHNPSDIEALLRKYAWLARTKNKPELFGNLLQYH